MKERIIMIQFLKEQHKNMRCSIECVWKKGGSKKIGYYNEMMGETILWSGSQIERSDIAQSQRTSGAILSSELRAHWKKDRRRSSWRANRCGSLISSHSHSHLSRRDRFSVSSRLNSRLSEVNWLVVSGREEWGVLERLAITRVAKTINWSSLIFDRWKDRQQIIPIIWKNI